MKLRILLVLLAAIIAAPVLLAATSEDVAAQAPPGAYNIRKIYENTDYFGDIPLREGYYNRATGAGFGYQKIVQKHEFYDDPIRYVLYYPSEIYRQSTTSQMVQGKYPRGRTWCIVVDQRIIRDGKPFGIVTAYPITRPNCK